MNRRKMAAKSCTFFCQEEKKDGAHSIFPHTAGLERAVTDVTKGIFVQGGSNDA
jgi:hypothetical protein